MSNDPARAMEPVRRLACWVIACALMLLAMVAPPAWAQAVTYDHSASATATGAGATGTPTLSFNVTAGQNRIVFITAAFERDHCTTNTTETIPINCTLDPAANGNFASPMAVTNNGANLQIQFTATGPGGSLTVTNPLTSPDGDLRFANSFASLNGSSSAGDALYSQEAYYVALYESQLRTLLGGAASGTITISLPNVDAPNRAGDEAILTALQFNNVNQLTTGAAGTGIVRSLSNTSSVDCNSGYDYLTGADAPGNWATCLNGYDAGQAPATANDAVLLYGFNGYARTGPMDFATVAGFTEVANPAALNTDPSTSGTAGAHFLTSTESDGFSESFQFYSGIPSTNITLQSQNGALTSAADTSGGLASKFTLTAATIDLSITKTDGVTTVNTGQSITYTVVVRNNSAVNYADGATVTDPATAGLSKTAVSCTASGGAVCPASLTVASLESGTAIPTFPPGSSLTFTITATVLPSSLSSVSNSMTVTPPSGYTDSVPGNNTATDTDSKTGSITLVKDAVPDDGQNFTFASTQLGPFTLDDDADATLSNTRMFTGLAAGNYSVTEGAFAGWTLTGLVCVDPTNNSSGNTSTRVASIVLATGEDVTCTYTNSKTGSITIVKDAVPNDAQDFAFTTTGTGLSNFSLDDDSNATLSNTRTFSNLTPGSYSVTETALAGWSLSNLACVDPDSGSTVNVGTGVATIDLDAGEDITCTYTNTKQGSITIVKDAVPNDAQDFAFTTTGTGLSSFSLDDDSNATLSNTRTFSNLTPGSYSVTETALAGWSLSNLACVDPDSGSTVNVGTGVATIDLDAGETITCTYTNTKQGSITIVKDAVPNDAQDFAFTTTGTGLSSFSLDDDADATLSNTRTFSNLTPGSYSVTETALAGWSLSNLACVDPDSGSSVSLATGVATIDLDAGEDITCTYTNTKQGSITIVKDAVPNDAQDFAFTATGTGLSSFSLDDDADATLSNTRTFSNLTPGSYSVTETALAGWSLSNLACVDPDSGSTVNVATGVATIDLDAGEDITCTYTNTKQGILRLQKTLPSGRFNATDQFTLSIAGSGAPAPVTTTGSGSTATGTVTVDPATLGSAYSLSETAAAGADLANYTTTYSCTNAQAGGQAPAGSGTSFSVTPVAGDDLTCTFVNTRAPMADLSIAKSAAPGTVVSGDNITYTLLITNHGPDTVAGAVVTDPVPAGLTCPGAGNPDTVNCSGAACTGAAPLTITGLTTSGITLGTLANGDAVTLTFVCRAD